MERNRNLWVIRLLVLGALAVGLQAKPASAQVFEGKFTLASEVRWGSATLPAGEYSFRLNKNVPQGFVRVYRGLRAVALIMPRGYGDSGSERSVILVESGAVRKLSLPQIGVELTFSAHNPAHRGASKEEQLAQVIPVAAAGAGR